MRRKTLVSFLFMALGMASALLTLPGCASVDIIERFREAPIALVSVVSNNDINWKGEGPTTMTLISRAIRRTLETDPDQAVITSALDIIDEAESIIWDTLDASPDIALVPRETVFPSLAYAAAKPYALYEKEKRAQPADYRYVYYRDKQFLADFAAETGIKKSLFVSLDLTKDMASGFSKYGKCRAFVSMSIMLKDEEGRTLFYKIYDTFSRDTADVSNGVYSQSQLRVLLLSAISDACSYFLDDIAY